MAILDSMKKREKELLASELFVGAIHMDVFNSHLLREQLQPLEVEETLERAKARVLQLAFQLQAGIKNLSFILPTLLSATFTINY